MAGTQLIGYLAGRRPAATPAASPVRVSGTIMCTDSTMLGSMTIGLPEWSIGGTPFR